ncbi:hypothetical protein F7725_014729 [Dissostichus mawsoni]|uniref:Uncharacterized protein n=1 Tax=Dissostichus mawsoni TaxID=36200 RepID=A0A7J5YZ14_DISMA|nr:hypothetical protein F7725_014729 [Dissostichus mawsoni]
MKKKSRAPRPKCHQKPPPPSLKPSRSYLKELHQSRNERRPSLRTKWSRGRRAGRLAEQRQRPEPSSVPKRPTPTPEPKPAPTPVEAEAIVAKPAAKVEPKAESRQKAMALSRSPEVPAESLELELRPKRPTPTPEPKPAPTPVEAEAIVAKPAAKVEPKAESRQRAMALSRSPEVPAESLELEGPNTIMICMVILLNIGLAILFVHIFVMRHRPLQESIGSVNEQLYCLDINKQAWIRDQ